MEKIPRNNSGKEKEEPGDFKMSKRSLLLALGAVAFSSSVPSIEKANVKTSPRPQPRSISKNQYSNSIETSPRPHPRPGQVEGEVVEGVEKISRDEQLKELTYQAYEALNKKALRFTLALHNDLDLVIQRMSDMVAGDDRYSSAMQLIYDQLPLSIPEPINSAVRDMMMYVPYVESRFSNSIVSSVQAFGFIQLMPSAWEELSREGEQRENIFDQVQVAGRLLDQTYRHLMNQHADTFDLISRLLFAGDMDRCGREFICPLLVNGYFSGMGTIDRVLDGFLADYVNQEEKARMQQEEILADEMGVYGLFSTAGEVHGYTRNFGVESGNYVPKIIAAKLVVRTGLPLSMLTELMPRVNGKKSSS